MFERLKIAAIGMCDRALDRLDTRHPYKVEFTISMEDGSVKVRTFDCKSIRQAGAIAESRMMIGRIYGGEVVQVKVTGRLRAEL